LQANDVFKTGIIVSDTDYRQFVRIAVGATFHGGGPPA